MPTPPQTRRSRRPLDPLEAPDLNAPELTPVRSVQGLVHPESRLNQYVHNEPQPDSGGVPWATPGEGGILRDNPFGASPVGGETPFFTGPTEAAASFEDDTEGIPLGLPGLLDLPDVPDPPAVPTTAAAPAADDDFEPATPAPAPRISRDPAVETQEALKHFLIGLAVASVAWFLVIGGWMFLLPR